MKKTAVLVFVLCSLWAVLSFASGEDSYYKICPEDVLQINVYEQPDLSVKTRVAPNGEITYPLLGNVLVSGMTLGYIEKKIAELLEKDYLVNPQVTVFIEEYHPKKVYVMGAVEKPGAYDMPKEHPMTAMEAVVLAGGFSKKAAQNDTCVIRAENGGKKKIKVRVTDITRKGEKDKDIPMEENDMVFVPESFF